MFHTGKYFIVALHIVSLDMASVVAGTKYRGQFEERIRSIINELQKNPNVILFIDEIHTIVGAFGVDRVIDKFGSVGIHRRDGSGLLIVFCTPAQLDGVLSHFETRY